MRALTVSQSLPRGRYRIDVRAVSADGTKGYWSYPVLHDSNPSPVLTPVSWRINAAPLLQWTSVAGALAYDVVVWDLASNRTVFVARGIESTSQTVSTLLPGNYAWWVIPIGHDGIRGKWSTPDIFHIVAPPMIIVRGPGYQFGFSPVLIEWSAVYGADHYDLWLSDSSRTFVIRKPLVQQTTFTLTQILPRAYYHSWVRAVDSAGVSGPWSKPEGFVIY